MSLVIPSSKASRCTTFHRILLCSFSFYNPSTSRPFPLLQRIQRAHSKTTYSKISLPQQNLQSHRRRFLNSESGFQVSTITGEQTQQQAFVSGICHRIPHLPTRYDMSRITIGAIALFLCQSLAMGNASSEATLEAVDYQGGVALKRWRDPPESVLVPTAVNGRRVCAVLDGCFRDCKSLRDFRFENGNYVKKIDNRAFEGCGLCSFVWPRGADTIPHGCFEKCESLRDFRFEDPSCVKKIGIGAFNWCISLCSFVWPRGVDTIPSYCFNYCRSLRDFRFEDASCVKKIEKDAFMFCSSLCSFVWPRGADTIPHGCFVKCEYGRAKLFKPDTTEM